MKESRRSRRSHRHRGPDAFGRPARNGLPFFLMQQATHSLIEEILAPYSGNDAVRGYKNHVLRVVSFCEELYQLDEDDREKVTIAACFHDLGIYTDNTFDYLPPSIELAKEYLDGHGLSVWMSEITSMISEHHSIRPHNGGGLIEAFRKADQIDFSCGLVRNGVARSRVREVRAEFPNLGFHRNLALVAGRWICRHPFRPVPVLKW